MTMVASHWSANAVALAVVAVVAAVHLRGTLAVTSGARRRGEGVPRGLWREAVIFYAGLLVVLVALVSPIGYWSLRYIWVRSVQDLLLANVAPALIVLGGPWLALRRGLEAQRQVQRRGLGFSPAGVWSSARALPAPGWPRLPVLALIAFNVVWVGWHVPVPYDAALRYPAVYAAEIVCYLGLGVAALAPVHRLPPAEPCAYPAAPGDAGSRHHYRGHVARHGAGVRLRDRLPRLSGARSARTERGVRPATGGAVLWVLMLPAYVIVGIALLIRWLNDEESQALTAGFDRLLKPAKPAWPSRPGP